MIQSTETLQALKQLKNIMQKTKNNRIYATVLHVSNSGMSRVIKFMVITKKATLLNITDLISKITGYKWDRNYYGLRIYGCGMDMAFNTLYNVNAIAYSYKVIKTSKNKNRHDIYYSGLVNSNYFNI